MNGSVWASVRLSARLLLASVGTTLLANAATAEPRLPPPPANMAVTAPEPTSLGANCNAVSPTTATRSVALRQTFFDDFHNFDPANTGWTLYYNRPHDPVAARTHDNNEEQQVYVDAGYAGTAGRPLGINPFSFEKGRLAITAHKLDDETKSYLHGRPYASGMLQSRRLLSQLYGYFEASIQIPAGRAMWPAFWMVPTDTTPPELDILESLGHRPEEIYSTLHWNYKDPKGHTECKRVIPDATKRSVVYGVLWTPEMIVYYTDRVPVQAVLTHPTMRRPMYMLINLAVGGKWPGPVTAETPREARMIVDWVAAYALAK